MVSNLPPGGKFFIPSRARGPPPLSGGRDCLVPKGGDTNHRGRAAQPTETPPQSRTTTGRRRARPPSIPSSQGWTIPTPTPGGTMGPGPCDVSAGGDETILLSRREAVGSGPCIKKVHDKTVVVLGVVL